MPQMSRASHRARNEQSKNINRSQRASISQQLSPNDPPPKSYLIGNSLTAYNKTMVKKARHFDKSLAEINFVSCSKCARSFPGLKVDSLSVCTECNKPGGERKFSAINKMEPGPIPPELTGLTYIEQMLIALVHPVVSVFRVKGAQYSYNGNVINFYQNIDSLTNILPHNPREIPSTVLFSKSTSSGITLFIARPDKLRTALIWLKQHNKYYEHIIISEENLSQIPDDGDLTPLLMSLSENDSTGNFESFTESYVPQLDPIDQQQQVNNALHLPFPTTSRIPINEYTEEGYIVKAFPCLFPHGFADLNQPRETELSPDEYFKFLMYYKDRRFINDTRFRFFAFNTILRRQANKTIGVYIKRSRAAPLNALEIKQRLQRDPGFVNQVMAYCAKIRSSKPYWRQRCGELLDMVDQIGIPTIFFTLSAADYHWPDLFRLIDPQMNSATLTESKRRELMHDNPAIVSYYFQERCRIYIDEVLSHVFDIEDYWYRYEWQWRGSPHVHGLLWLGDAPNRNASSLTDADLERIRLYFDRMCSAINPNMPDSSNINRATHSSTVPAAPVASTSTADPTTANRRTTRSMSRSSSTTNINIDTNEHVHPCRKKFSDIDPSQWVNDLSDVVNTVQRHTVCGSHCMRIVDGKQFCRFKFPMQTREHSVMEIVDGYFQFIPKRNDPLMQRFNAWLTVTWRANTDFSTVTNLHAVLNYIAKYASKGEKSSTSLLDLLNQLLSRELDETSAKKILQKLIIATLGERDYSAQEIIHLLLSWPLFHCSRQFVSVFIANEQWQRVNVNDETDESTGLSVVDKYRIRAPDLEDWSLIEYAKLLNSKGGNRRKEAVVRVFPRLKITGEPENDESFYRQQVILNIPFRGEFDNLLTVESVRHETWRSRFEESAIEAFEAADYPEPEDEGELIEGMSDDRHIEPYMAAAATTAVAMQSDSGEPEIGTRLLDYAYDWTIASQQYPSDEQVRDFLKTYRQNAEIPQVDDEQDPNIVLSAEQNQLLDICDQQIMYIKHQQGNPPKRVAIQGQAGSGKSTVIKAIKAKVIAEFGPDSIEISAPTGMAAINVNGKTLHSLFRIDMTDFKELSGVALQKFQLEMQSVRFLIVDEKSMIGCAMLHHIEQRCREAKPYCNDYFGGIMVYFFGDIMQLPPVRDTAWFATKFYKPYTAAGRAVLDTFDKFIKLKECHRQQGDESVDYRVALRHVSKGGVTQSDYELLMTRRSTAVFCYCHRTGCSRCEERRRFKDAPILCPKIDMTTQKNKDVLRASGDPVARIVSINLPDTAIKAGDADTNLDAILYLTIGCHVTLKQNLWVAGKLVNGSPGKVRAIVFAPGERPPSMPKCVLVEFDDYQGPCLVGNLFPIVPVMSNFKMDGVSCSRTQLPLRLAYAMTIHKSQGQTLAKAVVNIGDTEMSAGLTYVALSRVRKLSDLVIDGFFSKSRLDSITNTAAHKQKMDFINRYWPEDN